MYHQYIFICDNCGDELESESNQTSLGKCRYCEGNYINNGESYDQEWIDEQEYNEQQDREYEERHKYDDY